MHRALVVAALLATTLFAGASTAHAMRCGTRLVAVGDPAARVRSLCGDPTEVNERVIERSREVFVRRNGVLVGERVAVSVVVQEWIYDLGPQQLMRQFLFEDGRLVQMNTLGYGTERTLAPARASDRALALAPRIRALARRWRSA